ncbi:OsmC family peroxiredoxin [Vibrio sp. T187]|uniref:OsmC family protein n=1 Tax=Vibrio TaxID=662 RepID=UPI0010C9A7A1|nr:MULTISPECIES: OsmC family protein [Vibrio]MBW3695269.1 OsmC family peroxiredoxin [Vibrio sp. T187]
MKSIVFEAQKPLKDSYAKDPSLAMVTDHAITSGDSVVDPYHSIVQPMDGCGVSIPVGVHAAVGGKHDAPTPGDILCAALAACQDSSIRMVANLMGIELIELEVTVKAVADVRGTLMMDKLVPVGFQKMTCDVKMKVKDGTDAKQLERLQSAAKACCVVQQTLKSPPPVETNFIS